MEKVGRPRLAERHRAQRTEAVREEIVDAALTEFAERGYHDTSIAHIGERLGSAPSMIYNYFTNKREILESAFEAAVTAITAPVIALVGTSAGDADQFRAMAGPLGDAVAEAFSIDPRMTRILLVVATSSDQALRQRWNGLAESTKALVAQYLSDGVASGHLRQDLDAERTALQILAIPLGLTAIASPDPDEARAHVRAAVALVTNGIYSSADQRGERH